MTFSYPPEETGGADVAGDLLQADDVSDGSFLDGGVVGGTGGAGGGTCVSGEPSEDASPVDEKDAADGTVGVASSAAVECPVRTFDGCSLDVVESTGWTESRVSDPT